MLKINVDICNIYYLHVNIITVAVHPATDIEQKGFIFCIIIYVAEWYLFDFIYIVWLLVLIGDWLIVCSSVGSIPTVGLGSGNLQTNCEDNLSNVLIR